MHRPIHLEQLSIPLEQQLTQPLMQALIQSQQAVIQMAIEAKQHPQIAKQHPQILPIHLAQSSHSSTQAQSQKGQQMMKEITAAIETFPLFFLP